MLRQKILANVIGRIASKLAAGFYKTAARRKFGATPLARPKSGDLGGGGVTVELAAFAHGRFHPANGTAINSCGFHRHEKASIKTSIARQDSLVALVRI
jgi:hypothetical protein